MRFVRAIALVASFLIASLVAAPGAVAQTPPAGESYTSPTYGYVIPLDDEWTVESTESENGTDVLRITNGEIVAFVTGFPADGTPEDCIQDMAAVIQERPGHDNFEFETPIESTGNTAFGVAAYTFITAAGEQLDGRDRITCFALEDGAMVRLELLMLAGDVAAQQSAIDALENQVASALIALQPEQVASPEAASPEPASPEAAEPSATATSTTEPTVVTAATPTATATSEPPTSTSTTEPTIEPSPTQEPATAEEPLPDAASPPAGSGVDPSGTSYTSPQYGYSLSWDETFTVSEESSDESGDYLGLSSDVDVFIDLIGEPWNETQANCVDWLAGYYQGRSEYSNVVPAADPVSANPGIWETTGVIMMTYTSPETGESTDLANYVACSPLPDQGALVTLEQVTPADQLFQQTPLMDTVRAAFVPPASTGDQTGTATPAAPATPAATVTPSATAATPEESPVAAGDADYRSASFGYTLSWDDSWSIVDESTDPSGDYIRISNGPVNADLLSEPWDPAFAGSCFDLIVAFYTGNADYADVRGIEDETSQNPGIWDSTGVMSMTYLATTSGEPLDLINYVACSVDEAQGIIVSLEQFVDPESVPDQLEAMNTLRAGFTME